MEVRSRPLRAGLYIIPAVAVSLLVTGVWVEAVAAVAVDLAAIDCRLIN